MSDFRFVTDTFAVSPQIEISDVARAADMGVTLIINNRPDHEAPDQPPGAAIEAAARPAGVAYLHIPIVGGPSAAQTKAMHEAVAATPGKVLAFCRSGTRSINTWALGHAASGAMERAELVGLGAGAGYDLSWLPVSP